MADYTDTDDTSTLMSKPKKEKEITVVVDTGFFKHDTGDTYDGFFEAKKKDKSVRMNGPGTYRTNEGDTYTGIWENDKFGFGGEEVVISYHSGARYEGYIKDWSYHGKGKYTYPDGSVLSCEFDNNYPVGNLTLTDPNGHSWQCKADVGFAWFEPVNHYYEHLENVLDKAEIKRRRRECNRSKLPPFSHPSNAGPAAPKKDLSQNLLQPGENIDQKKRVKIGGVQAKV